jgi:type VI protein secretion system component Hcp
VSPGATWFGFGPGNPPRPPIPPPAEPPAQRTYDPRAGRHVSRGSTLGSVWDKDATDVDMIRAAVSFANNNPVSHNPLIPDPIPAGFFNPGSEQFDGVIRFGGFDSGADTVVRRSDSIVFPPTPGVSIELVSLSLVSCQPFSVNTEGAAPARWIDLPGYSFGVSAGGASTGGHGAGKVSLQDFTFTRSADKASAALQLHCASGKHIPEGVLTVRKAGEKPIEYLRVKLESVFVDSIQWSAAAGSDRPTESLSLNFTKLGFGIIVVGGADSPAVNSLGFGVNGKSGPLDVSVFGFTPEPLKATAAP